MERVLKNLAVERNKKVTRALEGEREPRVDLFLRCEIIKNDSMEQNILMKQARGEELLKSYLQVGEKEGLVGVGLRIMDSLPH